MAKSSSRIQFYLFRIVSAITFGLFACWSYLLLLEWWTVAIQKKTNNYVFNGRPWYYESAALYAKVMLIEGIILLAFLGLTTYLMIKKSNVVYLMLFAVLVYSFVAIVYGQTV
jgi:signal transduction histidine kinase